MDQNSEIPNSLKFSLLLLSYQGKAVNFEMFQLVKVKKIEN